MVHQKEEVLVCPSVKYADQIAQCKQIHCKECREKEKQHNERIETLEKKLKVMTIVGAIAATVVGKEIVDKVLASFDKVQDIQKKVDDAAGGSATPLAPTPTNPSDSSKTNPLIPVEQPVTKNPYSAKVDGEHSAFVTSLSTPYPMDPSMASHRNAYLDWDPSIVMKTTPTTVLAYELTDSEKTQTATNMKLLYEFPKTLQFHEETLMKNTTTNFTNNFEWDNGGSNYRFYTVPSPATISLLIPCIGMARRSRK